MKIKQHLEDLSPNRGAGIYDRKEILTTGRELGFTDKDIYSLIDNQMVRHSRGKYTFDMSAAPAVQISNPAPIASTPVFTAPQLEVQMKGVSTISPEGCYIPTKDPTYVPWGHTKDIRDALKARRFFPIFISGLSGNGKTMMVEQACAETKREYIRIQISPETDEDDLIGGFRLIEGETVFQDGPVLKAMRSGAVLMIDEIDRGSNKIMCLQGVLEGKPVLVKKTGQVVEPAPSFTVVATANTLGRGSDDGRYSAAGIIDDAFLERFPITMEQPWPSESIETKIVQKHMDKYGVQCEGFVKKLVRWSEVIRTTYDKDAVDDFISTRRLCHITNAFSMFGNEKKAIELCITRFDPIVKEVFMTLFDKLTPTDGLIDPSDDPDNSPQF